MAVAASGWPSMAERSRSRWRPVVRNQRVLFGSAVLFLMLFAALAAPLLSPFEPRAQNPAMGNQPPLWRGEEGTIRLFGTDPLGRDIYTRILYGARVSLLVGGAAVLVALLIGVPLGLLSGFFGGGLDSLIMRLVDVQLAIPFFLLAITLAAILGPGLINVIVLLGFTSWVGYARVVRAQVLSLRELPYIEAARTVGASPWSLVRRHLLPNAWTPVIVLASQQVGSMIVAESSLTFLGIGVPPEIPTWGGMIAAGRSYVSLAWWVATIPGIALTLTVVAIYFLGDGLRDVLDPKLKV